MNFGRFKPKRAPNISFVSWVSDKHDQQDSGSSRWKQCHSRKHWYKKMFQSTTNKKCDRKTKETWIHIQSRYEKRDIPFHYEQSD